jgi:hypothetical protein
VLVKELIEKLSRLPGEMHVYYTHDESGMHDAKGIEMISPLRHKNGRLGDDIHWQYGNPKAGPGDLTREHGVIVTPD